MATKQKQYKVKKKLILPLLKLEQHKPAYVKITEPIFKGKEITPAKGGKTQEKPADIANIINLDTGEEMQIIVAAVVKSVLEENYPDAGYVGKGFEIVKGDKAEGKRYFQYSVNEVEI
jgi:hypothetical protein